MDIDHIEITESDLGYDETRLRKIAGIHDRGAIIDQEKRLSVVFGIPLESLSTRVLRLPDAPHVFMADQLEIVDRTHPQGVVLGSVPILMAHGERDNHDCWKFANGQPVVATLDAYNKYAKVENLPPIEVIVACNRDRITESTGVRVSDLGVNSAVAHAVGEVMFGNGALGADNKFRMSLYTKDTVWNLDNLVTLKDIKIS